MDVDDGTGRLLHWEQRMELPLLMASLVFLTGYSFVVLAHDAVWRELGLAVLLLTWLAFGLDYAVRLRLSGEGPRFVRTHWLDTVVLVLPLLRPLRVVRVYTAVQRHRGGPRLSLHARVIAYAGLSACLLGYSAALAVYHDEHTAPGATIRTFGDAAWWAAETLTTVGYGDMTPVTARGRAIAVGLMVCGLALLGAVTGSFSAGLLQVFAGEEEKEPPAG
ncbi:potassium channel family protein [Streptomyces sp. NBC_00210]|uniref:potassium channel family protein n=1 Tax=unclassified Streptomyces TaxID=2593676 RepID=UPI003256837C